MVARLRDELTRQEDLLRAEKHRMETQVRDLSNQLAHEKEHSLKYQEQLRDRPSRETYNEMRRQLKVVQKIAFNVEDEDDEEDAVNAAQDEIGDATIGEPESTVGMRSEGKISSRDGLSVDCKVRKQQLQLEAMLSDRIKTLEIDLKEARKEVMHYQEQEITLKESVASMKSSIDSSTQLITKLEKDLEARSSALEQAVSVAAGIKPAAKNDSTGDGADLAELLGINESEAGSAQIHKSADQQKQQGSVNSAINMQMINILQTQRDSYKDRLTRIETSMQKLQRECETANAAKERLEADNLELYSKIRYLQSYSGATAASPSHGMGSSYQEEGRVNDEDYLWERSGDGSNSAANTPATAGARLFRMMRSGVNNDVENRYHALYEQRMNPFEQFSQHEKQRKLRELSVADRIVLNTTMAIVSSRTGRTVLLVYLGLMHLLVFGIIYYSTHHIHAGCDPSLDHHAATSAAISSAVAATTNALQQNS